MDRLFRTPQANIASKDNPTTSIDYQEDWVIAIEQAEYVKDYILQLKFSDGKETQVDFGPFLRQSLNPLIRKYLDKDTFKQFTVEYGDLYWNDYDLCFPIADLYEDRISPRNSEE
jgi:hypothetical protein